MLQHRTYFHNSRSFYVFTFAVSQSHLNKHVNWTLPVVRFLTMLLRNFLILLSLIALSACSDEYCFDNISNSSSAITALILARGGSKGVKLKNIQRIDGVSLLGISLTELQRSKRFSSIWVSTDHADIAEEASRCKLWWKGLSICSS